MSSGSKPTNRRPAPLGELNPAQMRALELLADRWTMWLLVAIDERGSRFSDLAGQPGLSRRVLTERLERLVDAQLVRREQYSARPVRHHYLLTERGTALRRICTLLLHVGAGGSLATGRGAPTAPGVPIPVGVRQESTPGRAEGPGGDMPTPASGAPDTPPPRQADHPSDRLLGADPEAAWAIYRETIWPLVRYDDQYRTPLVETLETWLECDASVSVAAARLYAHRHTVRYRLARVRELTGLDADAIADRERLLLGLRAMRMFQRAGRDLLAP